MAINQIEIGAEYLWNDDPDNPDNDCSFTFVVTDIVFNGGVREIHGIDNSGAEGLMVLDDDWHRGYMVLLNGPDEPEHYEPEDWS